MPSITASIQAFCSATSSSEMVSADSSAWSMRTRTAGALVAPTISTSTMSMPWPAASCSSAAMIWDLRSSAAISPLPYRKGSGARRTPLPLHSQSIRTSIQSRNPHEVNPSTNPPPWPGPALRSVPPRILAQPGPHSASPHAGRTAFGPQFGLACVRSGMGGPLCVRRSTKGRSRRQSCPRGVAWRWRRPPSRCRPCSRRPSPRAWPESRSTACRSARPSRLREGPGR